MRPARARARIRCGLASASNQSALPFLRPASDCSPHLSRLSPVSLLFLLEQAGRFIEPFNPLGSWTPSATFQASENEEPKHKLQLLPFPSLFFFFSGSEQCRTRVRVPLGSVDEVPGTLGGPDCTGQTPRTHLPPWASFPMSCWTPILRHTHL